MSSNDRGLQKKASQRAYHCEGEDDKHIVRSLDSCGPDGLGT